MSNLRAVQIRNPIGGPGWTSAKRAVKYVKRGQARIVGDNLIEFIEADYRTLSAGRSMLSTTEPARVQSPAHCPALLVVTNSNLEESMRTFDTYPYMWEGYKKAA